MIAADLPAFFEHRDDVVFQLDTISYSDIEPEEIASSNP